MPATRPIREIPAQPILQRYHPCLIDVLKEGEPQNALDLLNQLVTGEHFLEAIDFLAHWMPAQHGVWWGCLCLWDQSREAPSERLEQAIGLLVKWLHIPNDENRRNLKTIDTWFQAKQPISLLARAAFCSGGSLTRPDLPVVEPPKFAFCGLIGNTIKILGMQANPKTRLETLQQYLRFGMEVLQGANRWNEPMENQR